MQTTTASATLAAPSRTALFLRTLFGVGCVITALLIVLLPQLQRAFARPAVHLVDFFPAEQNAQFDYQFARPLSHLFLETVPQPGASLMMRVWSPEPLPARDLRITHLGRDGERELLTLPIDATARTIHLLLPPGDPHAAGYALALRTPPAVVAGDERELGLLYEAVGLNASPPPIPWFVIGGSVLLLSAAGAAVLVAGLGLPAAGLAMLLLAVVALFNPFRFAAYSGALILALPLVRLLLPNPIRRVAILARLRTIHAAGWLSLAIAITYGAYIGFLAVRNHELYGTNVYDLGLYDQTLWLISHGLPNYSSSAGINMVGSHANLMLFPLALLYVVLPDPRALLVFQALGVGAAALPLYWLARDRGAPWLGPVAALAYLAHPATQNLALFDFHVDSIAATLLIAALWAADRRRWILMGLLCAAVMLSKETFAPTVAWLGVLLIFWRREWRAGGLLIGASIVWFVIATRLIAPALVGRDESLHVGRFAQYGDSLGTIIWTMISRPQLLFADLFKPEVPGYLLILLAPLAFLPLLSPVTILALPALAINLLSAADFQRTIDYHYSALTIAIFAVGSLQVLLIAGRLIRRPATQRLIVGGGSIGLLVAALLCQDLLQVRMRRYEINAALANPERQALAAYRSFVLSLIPPDAAVSAQTYFGPHLTHRQQMFLFPNPFVRFEFFNPAAAPFPLEAEYVVFDVRRPESALIGARRRLEIFGEVERSGDYTEIARLEGMRLLRKVAP
ncbi:MAG: DUF2079 domain-containing protein [Oscillochloris sp.]|nr:DUF2079 domain-containing protein [Oscillochloris sp.]